MGTGTDQPYGLAGEQGGVRDQGARLPGRAGSLSAQLKGSDLVQGLATFLCKGPDGKYFQLCGPRARGQNYSALPSEHEAAQMMPKEKGAAVSQ